MMFGEARVVGGCIRVVVHLGPERLVVELSGLGKHGADRFGPDEIRQAATSDSIHLRACVGNEVRSGAGVQSVDRVAVQVDDGVEQVQGLNQCCHAGTVSRTGQLFSFDSCAVLFVRAVRAAHLQRPAGSASTVPHVAATTQEQILDATMSVIVRDGVRGTSMRTIADEADVSLGLISYHFDDKGSLIEAAFRKATDEVYAKSIEAVANASSTTAAVGAYIRAAFADEFIAGDYLVLRISLWAVARTDRAIARVERDMYQRYAEGLRETIAEARPELPAENLDAIVADVIVMANGLWLNWARFEDRLALARGLRICEELALSGPTASDSAGQP